MALIDELRKKQQELARQSRVVSPSVQQMQQSLELGMTGREQRQAGPATSSIGQQVAQQQAQAAQKGLEQQQTMQAQQLGAGIQAQEEQLGLAQKQQQAKTEQALKDIAAKEQMGIERRAVKDELSDMQLSDQERAFTEKVTNTYANRLADLASERKTVENNLLSDFRREQASLSKDKRLAELSQLAHTLAMADKRYVAQIQQTAAITGLRSDLEFQRESDRLVFGKRLELLGERLDQKRALAADTREFSKMMADIKLEDALKIAEQAQRAETTATVIEGVGTLAKDKDVQKAGKKWWDNLGSDSEPKYYDSGSTGYTPYSESTYTPTISPSITEGMA